MKKRTRDILSMVLLVVCAVSTLLLLRRFLDYRAGSDDYSDALALAAQEGAAATGPTDPAAQQITSPVSPETAGPVWVPAPLEDDPQLEEMAAINLDALRQVNPQVVGWIRIPDTPVDYPVLHGADNDYYLEHTWKGEENAVGAIFLEWQNSADMAQFNTIIYGHNMQDHSMFGSLGSYGKESYYQEHPYIYLATDQGVFRYEIFSSYFAQVGSDTYRLNFTFEKSRKEYIEMALEASEIQTGITPELNDRILTLSTCGGGYTSRRVVHARLKMVLE